MNYEFESGKIYGIVGVNGSGKSVLLKCLCGLEKIDTGNIQLDGKILGKDFEYLPNAGIIIENPSFLEQYSGFRNLKHLAMIQNKITDDEILKALDQVGLDPLSKQKVKHFSLGMKQKLALAQAFMEKPSILLLDEPTSALDEKSVDSIHQQLIKYRDSGSLVVIVSHHRDEVNRLCDHILYMDQFK